jgi:hypothetical protein
VLASGPEEAGEARAGAPGVVADASSRAVTTCFVTVAIQRIGAGGALLLVARGAAVASVTQATNMFHGVPGGGVHTRGFRG